MTSNLHEQDRAGVNVRETGDLISSRKVEGTAVFGRDKEKLGSINSFMVNKMSGQVEYAVLEFGGLFGIGSDYYPIPWNNLRYSRQHGGYTVNLDRTILERAPRFNQSNQPDFDQAYGYGINEFYGIYPPL